MEECKILILNAHLDLYQVHMNLKKNVIKIPSFLKDQAIILISDMITFIISLS
jgi:hypothetical protein